LPSSEVTITPHHPGESSVMVKAAQSHSQCHISVFYIVSIAIFGACLLPLQDVLCMLQFDYEKGYFIMHLFPSFPNNFANILNPL
jgi:hypothetical protein